MNYVMTILMLDSRRVLGASSSDELGVAAQNLLNSLDDGSCRSPTRDVGRASRVESVVGGSKSGVGAFRSAGCAKGVEVVVQRADNGSGRLDLQLLVH